MLDLGRRQHHLHALGREPFNIGCGQFRKIDPGQDFGLHEQKKFFGSERDFLFFEAHYFLHCVFYGYQLVEALDLMNHGHRIQSGGGRGWAGDAAGDKENDYC